MGLTVGDIPRIHARRHASKLAYVDGEVRLSWAEIDDRVNRLCNGLREQFHFAAGDRIAVLSQNSHEFVEIMFAASRLAAMYTGLNTRHHPNEMVQQMVDSGSRLLIAGPSFEAVGAAVAAQVGVPVLTIGEAYERLLADSPATPIDPHGDEHAPYTLTYTSGTTGEPKGAMISSRNEIVYSQSLAWAAESRHDDSALVVTPMFHKGGQFATMHPAYLGLTTVILPSPEPNAILEAIERHRPTFAVLVPTIMKMVIDAYASSAVNQARDLSSLRHVLYGSNPIPLPVLRQFSEFFSCTLSQIGGVGTEGGVALVLSRVDHEEALADPSLEHRLLSCGRVQPGFEMMLIDEDGLPAPADGPGEMVFRGDSFIAGYWQRPEASQRLWKDGWLHSGDIGRVDADGFVYYVDRKAGRIKTGGETVYSREVEAVLRESPLVAEVAVVGVPDELWGEALWACVERSPEAAGASDHDCEAAIREFTRTRLSGFKVPKRVVFFDQLPRTALGKLAVGDIRARAIDSSATNSVAER
jgi:acyl-CoA synthetase (AMP-forming)/AMP-acid ligase II